MISGDRVWSSDRSLREEVKKIENFPLPGEEKQLLKFSGAALVQK
jgi:hypothetical protein